MKTKKQAAFTLVLLMVFAPLIGFSQVDLGSASGFAIFTSVGAIDNDGITTITGDMGTNAGAINGFPPGLINGAIYNEDVTTLDASTDLALAFAQLGALSCDAVLGTTMGGGQVLTPQVYCLGAASTIDGQLVLDGAGDPNAVFVFQIDGALSTTTSSEIILLNSASLCNVYWRVNGAVNMGINSTFRGTIVANGAISLLLNSSLYGRGLSIAGAIGMAANMVAIVPPAIAEPAVDTAYTCKGVDFEFTTELCDGCTYQWLKNDHEIIGATSNTFSTNKPAHYSVIVNNPGGCSAASNHIFLQVSLYPNANIFAPNGLNICAPSPGANVLLKVGYFETNSYQWYKDGEVYTGTGANSWKIYPEEAGNYRCYISNLTGCERPTAIRTVTNSCRLGNERETMTLSVYPNPSSSIIHLSINTVLTSEKTSIEIINMLGEVVYSEIMESQSNIISNEINISKMLPGVYMLKASSDEEQVTTQFIIQ